MQYAATVKGSFIPLSTSTVSRYAPMSEVVLAVTRYSVQPHLAADRRKARFVADRLAWWMLRAAIYALIVQLSLPFIGGAYYSLTGDHTAEQQYLNRCIIHLKVMRACSDDPDVNGILDYTIRRYHKVGAWNVMFMPLTGPVIIPGGKAIGCNCPWCPGVTLDTCLLIDFPPEETAIVLAHEALHDYWPFFGHGHINAREKKLHDLSNAVRRRARTPSATN
jgi:hypothetical protein